MTMIPRQRSRKKLRIPEMAKSRVPRWILRLVTRPIILTALLVSPSLIALTMLFRRTGVVVQLGRRKHPRAMALLLEEGSRATTPLLGQSRSALALDEHPIGTLVRVRLALSVVRTEKSLNI